MTKQDDIDGASADPTFELYDLRVEISERSGRMIGEHAIGDHFELRGENLFFPEGQGFSIYALGALLPLLAAKQRDTHRHDWMTTDEYVADPDPNCHAIYKITRIGKRTFRRADTTDVPLT